MKSRQVTGRETKGDNNVKKVYSVIEQNHGHFRQTEYFYNGQIDGQMEGQHETRGPWDTKLTRAPVQNCHHLLLDWHDESCMLHFKLHNLLTCIFIQTINYQFPRPRMLQVNFELKWASGFKFKDVESVDTTDNDGKLPIL